MGNNIDRRKNKRRSLNGGRKRNIMMLVTMVIIMMSRRRRRSNNSEQSHNVNTNNSKVRLFSIFTRFFSSLPHSTRENIKSKPVVLGGAKREHHHHHHPHCAPGLGTLNKGNLHKTFSFVQFALVYATYFHGTRAPYID